MKKLLSIILVAMLACSALVSCTSVEDVATPAAEETVAENVAAGALTYIGLRINPEVEMVSDETGTVVSANAVNEDGEVLLSTTELEGKTVEDATVAFTEAAVDLGFMDPEEGKDTVYVDVNGENKEINEKVEKTLEDKLNKFFEKKALKGKVSKEVLDTYIESADEWNVSPGHAKLIVRTLEANPELTYDELLNLTVKDLLELMKEDKHEEKISANVKHEYKEKIEDVKEDFEDLFELRDDIKEIKEELKAEDLTAEEKAELEEELAEKEAELKEIEDEYKNMVDEIKGEFKEISKGEREECRKEAEERKQAKKDGRDFDDDDDDDDDDEDEDDDDEDDDDEDDDDDKFEDSKKPAKEPDDATADTNGKGEHHKGDKAPVADEAPEAPEADDDDDDDDDKSEDCEKPAKEPCDANAETNDKGEQHKGDKAPVAPEADDEADDEDEADDDDEIKEERPQGDKHQHGDKAPEAPATEAPATEAPATEAPATEAPATEAPVAETTETTAA